MFNNCTSLIILDISKFDFSIDTYDDMFNILNNLKYLNIKNVVKGDYSFPDSPLNSIDNLKVCQSETLIDNVKATNICCVFDITTLDCKSTPDGEENYIILHFSNACTYSDNGFVGDATKAVTRDTYVKDIVIGETTYQKTDTLTIEANTDVIINFNAHAESLQGFFNKNSDANVVNIKSIDFSHFIWTSVTNMNLLFSGCSGLESINFGEFNTGAVTTVSQMFTGCSKITSIDLSKLVTSSITNMNEMFSSCSRLESLNLSNFNTENVSNMDGMFNGCIALQSIDISKFNTANVLSMNSMFSSCNALKSIDLSKFNTAKVTSMGSMFS